MEQPNKHPGLRQHAVESSDLKTGTSASMDSLREQQAF